MFEEIRAQYFSAQLIQGFIARPIATRREFYAITGQYFGAVFSPFSELGAYTLPTERREKLKPLAEAFAHTHQEHFVVYDDNEQVVGWSYGEMHDTETFFMTNSAILPQYQRRGLYTALTSRLIAYLTELGYERITSNHQPNNRAVLIAKLRAGFVLSGMILDERWSAQVQMTYHIHTDRKQGFARAFSLENVE